MNDTWRQQRTRYSPSQQMGSSRTRSIPIQYASPQPQVELYNTIDDNRIHPNYEEPESEYYEKLTDFVQIPQPSTTVRSLFK